MYAKIGLFGCSIVINTGNIAEMMMNLFQYNLLYMSNINTIQANVSGTHHNDIYLTNRESQCLSLYARGKTAKEIAKIYCLSYRTVEYYLENIKMKFGVSRKSELISMAFDYKLA